LRPIGLHPIFRPIRLGLVVLISKKPEPEPYPPLVVITKCLTLLFPQRHKKDLQKVIDVSFGEYNILNGAGMPLASCVTRRFVKKAPNIVLISPK
jgi:hypothetical protein